MMNWLRGKWVLQGCAQCLRNNVTNMSSSSSAIDVAYYSYEKLEDEKAFHHPMIILHGLMGSRQNWQSLAKVFGKSGRRVIAMDARNHGESVHVDDMNYYLFRDDLLRLMDNQNLAQAVIVGHSMGGKTAMTTALTHGERVAGLVVVDVAPTLSPSVNRHPAYLEAMLRIPLMTMEDGSDVPLSTVRKHVLQELAASVQDEAMRHFLASNLIVKDGQFKWRCNLDSIINNFADIAKFPEFGLEQYYGQTLFLGGSRSDYIKKEQYPLIKKYFPTAEIKHIEGAGHWVHADKPALFIQAINKFLLESGL